MADNETTADIIAAMRDEAARADMEQGYSIDDAAEMMREFAWRFEAAHRREVRETEDLFRKSLKKQEDTLRDQYEALVGFSNIAKLREALEFCVRSMCGYCRMDAEARGMTTECVNGCEALLMAKAALAATEKEGGAK